MILNQFWRNARREIENQFNTASQITSIQMTLVLNVRRLQKVTKTSLLSKNFCMLKIQSQKTLIFEFVMMQSAAILN